MRFGFRPKIILNVDELLNLVPINVRVIFKLSLHRRSDQFLRTIFNDKIFLRGALKIKVRHLFRAYFLDMRGIKTSSFSDFKKRNVPFFQSKYKLTWRHQNVLPDVHESWLLLLWLLTHGIPKPCFENLLFLQLGSLVPTCAPQVLPNCHVWLELRKLGCTGVHYLPKSFFQIQTV